MDILKHICAALLLLLFCTSCITDFEPDIESQSVLCMDATITPGDSILLYVTRTWRWSDGHPNDRKFNIEVDDAEVQLIVNGQPRERLKKKIIVHPWNPGEYFSDEQLMYVADYIPRSGDRIRFEAVSPTYGEAQAEVTVPFPVEIDKTDIRVVDFHAYPSGAIDDVPEAGEYQMELDLKLWFTDPADLTNYYDFTAKARGGYSTENSIYGYNHCSVNCWFDYEREPLFTEHVSALESALGDTWGYTIFSDRQIAGKSYPLSLRVTDISVHYSNPGKDPEVREAGCLELTLKHVSESYYKHVLSLWEANDALVGSLGGIGLADPVFAWSNVSTGAGVVSAVAPFTVKIPLMDLIVEQMKNQ